MRSIVLSAFLVLVFVVAAHFNTFFVGTKIWSDGWAAYKTIKQDLGFDHEVVIHENEFVTSAGVHTNKQVQLVMIAYRFIFFNIHSD